MRIIAGGTTDLDKNRCPECGKRLNAATGRPRPGAPLICVYCGELLIFDARLRLARPTPDEVDELQADRELWRTLMDLQHGFRMADRMIILRGKPPQ